MIGTVYLFLCSPEFQIELIEWKYEDLSPNQNGGITRKVITAGTSKYYHPNEGATVRGQFFYSPLYNIF